MADPAPDLVALTFRVVNDFYPTSLSDLQAKVGAALVAGGWTFTGGRYLSKQSKWYVPDVDPPADYKAKCLIDLSISGGKLKITASDEARTMVQSDTFSVFMPLIDLGFTYRISVTNYSFVMYIPGVFTSSDSRGIAMMAGVPQFPRFQQDRSLPASPQVQEAVYCVDCSNWRNGYTSLLETDSQRVFVAYKAKNVSGGTPLFHSGPIASQSAGFQLIAQRGSGDGGDRVSGYLFKTTDSNTDRSKWAPLLSPIALAWGNGSGDVATIKGFLYDCLWQSKSLVGDSLLKVDTDPNQITLQVFTNNNDGAPAPATMPGSLLVAIAGGTE